MAVCFSSAVSSVYILAGMAVISKSSSDNCGSSSSVRAAAIAANASL